MMEMSPQIWVMIVIFGAGQIMNIVILVATRHVQINDQQSHSQEHWVREQIRHADRIEQIERQISIAQERASTQWSRIQERLSAIELSQRELSTILRVQFGQSDSESTSRGA